jgi:PAS domain S-box-containing protein
MLFIERASIKRKQVLISMLIASVALLLACAAFGAYEVLTFRKTMLRDITTLAEIVGDNSAAALDFDDSKAAEETLGALKAEPNIVGACIFDKNGRLFAKFDRPGDGRPLKTPPLQEEGHTFSRYDLTLFHAINYKGDVIGTVYMVSDMQALYARLERYGAIAGGVFGVTMLIVFVLSARLQRLVSDPILRLVQTTRAVGRDKDYSIRVARHSQDEIGELIDGFNEMLTQIQQRDAVLQRAHGELEQRVRDRTQELAGSLSLVHATLESTADGILVADGVGKATNWNQKFMLMWRIPSEVLESGDERRMLELAMAQLKDPQQFVAKVEELYGHMDMESFDVLEFKDGRVFERYSQPQRIEEKCVGRVWSFRDITERKRAEQELQASLEQLRLKTALFEALVNSSPDGILVVDEQGRKILQTQRTNELWKIPPEMVENQNDAEQVKFVAESTRNPEQFRDKVLHLYSHPDETSRDEIEFKDGRILERYSAPVLSVDKKYYGRIWSFRDITERKRVEAELDYERELLRSLLNSSQDHIYFKDLESRFIKCSQRQAERYRAKSVEDVIGKTDRDFFDEEHAHKALADEQEIIRTGRPMFDKVERVLRKGEDKVAWSLTNKMPLRNKAGEIIGTFGISKDITALKLVEAELAAERDLLGMLMENSPDMIYFKDRESRFVRASKAFADRLGSERPEDVVGKRDFDIYSEEHARPAYEDEQEIIRTGKPLIGKIEKEAWPDGRVTWVLTSKMPLRDKDGEMIGTFGISKDITAIKQVEAELAAERDLLGTLMENSPDMIYFKDLQSRILRSSKTHVVRMGKTQYDDVVGKTDFDFFSEEHARPAFEDEMQIIRTGKPVIGKIEHETWESGQSSWVLTSKMPLRDKEGRIIGTFGISKDISAIKEAEARLEEVHRRLLETSRMAGMAEVATSVLHNVGNVLNSVNVSCSVVTDRVHKSKVVNLSRAVALMDEHERDLAGFLAEDPKGKQLPAYLKGVAAHLATEQEEILRELSNLSHNIDHIKEIVAMQQSYSKVSGVREFLPAVELVEDALRMNGAAFERHQVKVIREYSAVPPVTAERHKVLQILINIMRNAKYACDESQRGDKQVVLRIEPAGDRVRIAIIDNGVGIPAQNLTRIFEHGFTTRKDGHGFGLHSGALAAKDLGGSLSVTSDGPGRGACFALELPCQPTEHEI